MSIRDVKCIFPAYELSGGTGASDVIETGFKGDAYVGLWLVVRGIEAAAGGTSVVVKLQTASDESFTSPVDLFTSGSIALAALTSDTEHVKVRMPLGCDKYLRLKYEVTGTFTDGTIEGYLTPDVTM